MTNSNEALTDDFPFNKGKNNTLGNSEAQHVKHLTKLHYITYVVFAQP